jgi:hypothetical protein
MSRTYRFIKETLENAFTDTEIENIVFKHFDGQM